MPQKLRSLFGRWTRGAFFAILAWAIAPAIAGATCGDYVHILPPGASASDSADGGNEKASPSSRPVPPCRGPHCSLDRDPHVPLAPPVTSAPTFPVDAILHDSIADNADPGLRLQVNIVLSPSLFRTSIFHPPRF